MRNIVLAFTDLRFFEWNQNKMTVKIICYMSDAQIVR